jgi:hypothetical protein
MNELWAVLRRQQQQAILEDAQRQEDEILDFLTKHPEVTRTDIYLKVYFDGTGFKTKYTAHAMDEKSIT